MNTPYGLEIIENCVTCKLRQDKWFCGLSPEVLKSFSAASHLSTYPGGAVLFVEGQTPRGAWCFARARSSFRLLPATAKYSSSRWPKPGEALGLSAVISGTPYELTAETAGPCQVNFIDRESLMKLLDKYGELGLHSAQALSREFQSAYRDIHELVLARSSAGKLAVCCSPGAANTSATVLGQGDSHPVQHDPRGDCADDRFIAGDSDPPVKRTQEERIDSSGRFDFGDPQSAGVGSAGCVALMAALRSVELAELSPIERDCRFQIDDFRLSSDRRR